MKKKSIAIGIPVYNEEKNIMSLLTSIAKQKVRNGKLVRIYIVSDASTDNTVKLVKSFTDPRITLLINKKRRGVNVGKNRILRTAQEDILVFLNGDVILTNEHFLEEITKPLIRNRKVGCTGASISGVKPQTFFETIIRDSHNLKIYMAEHIHNGNNIYMNYGGSQAFSRDFYTKLTFPVDVPEDAYSYLYCIQKGFLFKYSKKAQVLFRLPTNFSDHKKQSTRFVSGQESLKRYFSNLFIQSEYHIPTPILLSSMLIFLVRNPLTFIGYIFFTLYLRIISKQYTFSSIWEPSSTSKEVVK